MDDSEKATSASEGNRLDPAPESHGGHTKERLGRPESRLSPEQARAIREGALEILRRELPASPNSEIRGGSTEPTGAVPESRPSTTAASEQTIPARMLNEFVYCQRLFYYEFVEGVFVESADTLRGEAIHQRVDTGSGALPSAKRKPEKGKPKPESETPPSSAAPDNAQTASADLAPQGEGAAETIHSRSVQMDSDRLGAVAKMDLVEARVGRENASTADTADLFTALQVCPVDYKAGAPREGEETNELWDTDKMQLGLQALILRDNGYACNEGIIYYRATRQRVRLPITSELESWILQTLTEARRIVTGPIPPPLANSPKCVRCSLAPVCLPDETRMLAHPSDVRATELEPATRAEITATAKNELPRRLIAPRDDTRPLYLNTQGFRVGCKDEVLQIKDKDKLVEDIRLRDLSHVALFGNIQISTQAIQSLCDQEIPVTYFSVGGWFYGITRGHGLKNVFLRMEQFRIARDERVCLSLARQFVQGKIRNHRTLLMRNHLEPPEPTILKLKRASEDALAADSIETLSALKARRQASISSSSVA
jgi:CRISPR-associated protein Cas1